jgi:purine-binding chemotaxis protein CheW
MKSRRPASSGGIDWQRARERLARAQAALEGASKLSPERARAVMAERARALARVPPRAPDATEVLEAALFRLGGERYAIETRHIREVVRFTTLTPVPGAPESFVGLLSLRGEVLAVFDLHRCFGVEESAATDHSRVIVVGSDRAEFGILADTVDEVAIVRTDEVHAPPASIAGLGRELVRGVTRDGLIVLDGIALLQANQFIIDQADQANA